MATPVKIDEVREEERDEIVQRREKIGLASDDVSNNLVGLCLSGGALRSASFCLGLVQALQHLGLWKFVDYLSTVSGGGYIGAYLTSSTLKDKRPVTKYNQPLNYDGTPEQPARVQRFIYGGYYLLRPWRLANNYLMGVFFINLAIFSGLVAVCALLAFLWRALDYPAIRDRAAIFSLGDDLAAPFWPFWVFGTAWLMAWVVSLFRRGSDATGVVARYLLGLTIASLLIGFALLAGNGDIAGFENYLSGNTTAIGGNIWGPAIALVIGGLLPFLHPKRLLQSGMKPSRPWERYVFAVASTALLVGLPLLLVGLLSRENISGYNDNPYRPMIRTDIHPDDWLVLCELVAPDTAGDSVTGSTEEKFENALERAVAAIRLKAFAIPKPDQPLEVKDLLSGVVLSNLDSQERAVFYSQIDVSKLLRDDELNELLAKAEGSGGQEVKPFLFRVDLSKLSLDQVKALLDGVDVSKAKPEEVIEKLSPMILASDAQNSPKQQPANDAGGNSLTAEEFDADLSKLDFSGLPPKEIKKLLSRNDFLNGLSADDAKKLAEKMIPKLSEKQDELTQRIASMRVRPKKFEQPVERVAFSKILRKPYKWSPELRSETEQAEVDLHLRDYLTFTANDLRNEKIPNFRQDRAELLDAGQWHRWRFGRYALRCFSMLEGTFERKGKAYDYWHSKLEVEESEDDFCAALNELLASRTFLVDRFPKDADGEIVSSIGTGDDKHTKRINERLVDWQLTGVEKWQDYEVAELNRLLLEHDFGNIFRQRSEIRRLVSIYEDQIARLTWFVGALAVFLVAGMWVDLNSLSLHRYYRNRLAQAFIVPRNPKSPSIALSDMDTTEYGGPYHLITGSVGMIRKRIRLGQADDHHALRDCQEKIDQRWVDNFLFSRRYCGSELTDYVDTASYENSVPGYTHKIDLAEATAISGAALSPQHVKNWLLAFLMVAMNLSLGQYVPNPRAGRPRFRPRVLAILLSLWKKAENRPYCFVSDGGHCENLGLVQLLKRRCKLIIAADVSCDPEHYFHDLGRAIRIERVHAGIRLVAWEKDENGEDQEFSTDDLRLRDRDEGDVKQGNCKKHYFLARIKYPDAEDGLLVYIKPSFDGDESPDLIQYRHQNKEFPHDSTSDQLFDEAQVEAYRALGYHIGMQLKYHLPPEIRVGELWDYGAKVDADQLCEWFVNAASLRSPERLLPIVEHPATASEETLAGVRPIYKELIQQMRSTAKEPADILSSRFVEIVDTDETLKDVGMPTAVAAIQCAVVDSKQPSATDREYCVWLLQSLEQDENIATNLPESLDVLLKVAEAGNPDRVRLAAIATLAILGRGSKHRARVKDALTEFRGDPKANIRLAVKNALSNFKDSPRKAR